MTAPLRIDVLGPLGIEWHGEPVAPGPQRLQALLAVLALKANRVCTAEELFDAVWSDRPPGTGLKVLPPYIYRLRRALPYDGLLERTQDGYVLRLPDDALDVARFETTAREAAQYRADGELEAAAAGYQAALDLFRGEPLRGLPGHYLAAQRARLTERRDQILGDRIDLDLERGRHAEVIAELLPAVADRPFDERLAGQLMRALYADGRQADALEVYARTRETLVDQLGVEPGQALRAIHQDLLQTDSPEGRDELPYAGAALVGRLAELETLATALRPTSADTPPIVAIDGMAGVGKTALAVHAARRVASLYPDGQLFVDLHGHTPGRDPLDASAALDHLLTSVGVPAAQIPPSEDSRIALWRSAVAGHRLLIVLDNARSSETVRPLLPGSPTCGVLVTSRTQLTSLDPKARLPLGLLESGEAAELLAELIGRERAGEDVAAGRELVERCGNLPLAIRIAGARLRHRPTWTVAHINERLDRLGSRLTELSADGLGVATAFELSYQQLSADQQRMFRLLSLLPGRDIDRYGAAALGQLTPDEAGRLAESLVDANLLLEPTPDRYQFHDLLRDYAGELARSQESSADLVAAGERLLEYYLQASNHPLSRLAGLDYVELEDRPSILLPDLDTEEKSVAWADAEAPNLASAVHRAAADGHDTYTWLLALGAGRYLHHRGRSHERDAVLTLALESTRRLGDREAEARVLHALGRHSKTQYGVRKSAEYLREAADRLPPDGDPVVRVQILSALGNALMTLDPLGEAMPTLQEALRLARRLGDDKAVAQTHAYLAVLYAGLHDYVTAVEHYQESLNLFSRFGTQAVMADLLSGIAECHLEGGRIEDAIAAANASLELADRLSLKLSKPYALGHLGRAHRQRGELNEAVRVHEHAVEVAITGGSLVARSSSRLHLGRSLLAVGRVEEAREQFDEALRAALENDQEIFAARAWEGQALLAAQVGETDRAADLLNQALEVADRLLPPYADRLRKQLADLS